MKQQSAKILETIPFTSKGSLFPMSNRDNSGFTKTAVAVDIDVITMLSGAIVGSVRKVAYFDNWALAPESNILGVKAYIY
ncbi:hypothetical protein HanIR_Chr14g0689421 [Helianthus annuus]|nr:hypothetical protein HanIR_Chr14g0689421 [Helianthus annuus]